MIPFRNAFGALALTCLFAAGPPVAAQQDEAVTTETPAATPGSEKPAPYDAQLARLSEILGSVHYLRTLCNPGKEDDWRTAMQQLLDTETRDEPGRRETLTAAFNRGYRSFASVYTDCTAAAVVAEERYRNEGATLATEIAARFGN